MYKNRVEAGFKLAEKLIKYRSQSTLVLALARGGVVVGFEVAKYLKVPLEVIIIKKIGAPFNPEFGIGAVAENQYYFIDDTVLKSINLTRKDLENAKMDTEREIGRQIKLYRAGQKLPDLSEKIVILVDDGIATGVTVKAAILLINKLKPKKLILAVPVCPITTANEINKEVDDFVCLLKVRGLSSVGAWYEDFKPVSDWDVVQHLKNAKVVL